MLVCSGVKKSKKARSEETERLCGSAYVRTDIKSCLRCFSRLWKQRCQEGGEQSKAEGCRARSRSILDSRGW